MVVAEPHGEHGGLQALEAAQAPGREDDVGGQKRFLGVGGAQVTEPGVAHILVLGPVLMLEDNGPLGRKGVLEGVEAGASLTLVGEGTGRAGGVPAICFDLFGGSHRSVPTYLQNTGGDQEKPGWRRQMIGNRRENPSIFS
jgi:hypothetical protein